VAIKTDTTKWDIWRGVPYTEGALVYKSADQSIPNLTWTTLTFDSEAYDTDGIHDPSTNNSRLTCRTAGKYLVYFALNWHGNDTGYRHTRLRKNGATFAQPLIFNPGGTVETILAGVIVLDLSVGDYVEVMVYQNTGSALDIHGSDLRETYFGMQRIG